MLKGHLGSFFLHLVFYPVVSRLFDDITFSEYSIFLSLNTLLTIVGTFRFELAIPMSGDKNDAGDTALASFINWLIVSMIFIGVVGLFSDMINSEFKISFKILLLVVPSSFFNIIYYIYQYWANKESGFKQISWSKIIHRLSQIVLILIFTYLWPTKTALIYSIVLANFMVVVYYFRIYGNIFHYGSIKRYIRNFNKNRNFFNKVLPMDAINIISQYLPIWLITYYFNEEHAGQYAFALSILMAPVQILSNSISPVFYRNFIETPSKKLLLSFWKQLFLIGLIPALIGVFGGKFIFIFIFGNNWETAAVIFQIMCFTFFLQAISNSTSMAYLVLKLETISLIISLVNIFGILIGISIAYHQNNLILFPVIYSIFITANILIFNLILFAKSNK